MQLAERIATTDIAKGKIGLFYLGQSGFVIKTSTGEIIVIDAYLSDAAERLFGFKRMLPAPIRPEELQADLYVSTHEHIDHLDLDSIMIIAACEKTYFIGAPDCETYYQEMGLDGRYQLLAEGKEWSRGEISIRAIYADHGTLAPEAVGFLLEVNGLRIYHTGDTGYRPDEILASLATDVDVLLLPINGQYGNMNAHEACQLANHIKPRYLIPMHFWMFVEHVASGGVGDPAAFIVEAAALPEDVQWHVMAPGELFCIKK